MAFTSYLNENILNYVFSGGSYSPPSTFYVALYTSSSSEVTGDGYERQSVSFGSASDNTIESDSEVRFPVALSDWGEVTHVGLFDSATGGNQLDFDEVQVVHDVKESTRYTIPAGDIKIRLDKCEE